MKKTLVALAIAGAYTGVAYAQSTVTLYGLIDTYVEAAKTNGDSVTKVSAGGLNGPRWGLTGAEDLGGGLKAVFTLEGGYNSDTGTIGQGGRIFGRQMFVGLAGGFGQFLMGRQYAPIFYTEAASDIDGYSVFSIPGNSFSVMDANTLRTDNMVKYITPNLGPVSAQLSWAPGEQVGDSTKGRIWGANISGTLGPVTLVAGYHDNEVKSATVDKLEQWAVGGNGKFMGVGLAANYTEYKATPVAASSAKVKQWSVGANYAIGAFLPLVQYGETKNDFTDGKEKSWMLGVDYNMSKRTTIYGRYAETKEDSNAEATGVAWYGLQNILPGEKNQTFAIGLRHKF